MDDIEEDLVVLPKVLLLDELCREDDAERTAPFAYGRDYGQILDHLFSYASNTRYRERQ